MDIAYTTAHFVDYVLHLGGLDGTLMTWDTRITPYSTARYVLCGHVVDCLMFLNITRPRQVPRD